MNTFFSACLIFIVGLVSSGSVTPNQIANLTRMANDSLKSINQFQLNAQKYAYDLRGTFSWADPKVIRPVIASTINQGTQATASLLNGEASKKFEHVLSTTQIGPDGRSLKDALVASTQIVPGADRLTTKKTK